MESQAPGRDIGTCSILPCRHLSGQLGNGSNGVTPPRYGLCSACFVGSAVALGDGDDPVPADVALAEQLGDLTRRIDHGGRRAVAAPGVEHE